jgi:hypothetical protein
MVPKIIKYQYTFAYTLYYHLRLKSIDFLTFHDYFINNHEILAIKHASTIIQLRLVNPYLYFTGKYKRIYKNNPALICKFNAGFVFK